MRPIAGVWRKGNRRASKGLPNPHRQTYWPLCGSPSVEFLERRAGGVEFVWVCRTCNHLWIENHWVPLARMKDRRHHVPSQEANR